MSHAGGQNGRMTILSSFQRGWAGESEVVATFGRARLLRSAEGRYELRGGSATDQADACEWISLFLHEAVVDRPGTRHPGLAAGPQLARAAVQEAQPRRSP